MVHSSSQTMYVEILMLTSKSPITEMLYHKTTIIKLETAIEKHGRTHQAVACYHMHTHSKSGYIYELNTQNLISIAMKIIKTII